MGIYSANRLSSVNTGSIRPDMSYAGTAGMGRCMYESTMNDCALVESMLMQDFNEVKGIREGTIMTSEIGVMQENAVKDFFAKCKELLTKLGQKIAGVFRQVYAKLTRWFVRNGKTYVAMHRKTVLSKDISKLEIKDYRAPKKSPADVLVNLFKMTNINVEAKVEHRSYAPNDVASVEDKVKEYLKMDPSDYPEYVLDQSFEKNKDIKGSDLNSKLSSILDNVAQGRKPIKDLKKSEAEAMKTIKKAKKDLDAIEKKIDHENDKSQYRNDAVAHVRACVNAIQRCVNLGTSSAIKAIKFGIKQDRSIIAAIVAYSPKNESGILMREAVEDAADEVDEILDSPEETEVPDGVPDFEEVEVSDDDE